MAQLLPSTVMFYVIPITIQLQPINQGGEGELLTSNLKKRGGDHFKQN